MEEVLKLFVDVLDFEHGEYCIYLRKSRTDLEAEAKGEGETLVRHLRLLLELARKMKITIGKIYHEVVSGENISDRPKVQEMLEDVRKEYWKGVLVVEVERLARGNTKDQGIIAESFTISNTKIITPIKTYNPDDEFDEEYFEFGLFMSRREYKVINRRLQRGRVSAIKEGKFVGNVAPYGWKRVKLKNEKGFTLEPDEKEVKTLQLAYDLFALNNISLKKLGKELDSMGLKPRKGDKWSTSTLKDMLRNPVNIGMVRWFFRRSVKVYKNGKIVKTRPRNSDYTLVKGLQPAVIKKEVWDIVQEKLSKNRVPVQHNNTIYNPLAGLVYCSKCGSVMQRRPYKAKGLDDTLICTNTDCDNVSSKLYIVENKVKKILKDWLYNYKIDIDKNLEKLDCSNIKNIENIIEGLKKEISIKEKKSNSIYEFLEDGTYTKEIFTKRIQAITEEVDSLKEDLKQQERKLEEERIKEQSKKDIVMEVKNVLDIYDTLKSAEEKNALLKTVVKRIDYLKTEKAIKKDSDPENFILDIYPKINNKTK